MSAALLLSKLTNKMENATTLDVCLERLRGKAAREETTLSAEIEPIVKLCQDFDNEYKEGPYFGLTKLNERVQKRIRENLQDKIRGTALSLGFVPNTIVEFEGVRDIFRSENWEETKSRMNEDVRTRQAIPQQQFSLYLDRRNGNNKFNIASLVFPVPLDKVSREYEKGTVVAGYGHFTIYSNSRKSYIELEGCGLGYPDIKNDVYGEDKWSRFASWIGEKRNGTGLDWGHSQRKYHYDSPYGSNWAYSFDTKIYHRFESEFRQFLKSISPNDRAAFVKLIEERRRDLANLKENFSGSFGGVVADYTGAGEKLALHEFEEKAPEAFMRVAEKGINAVASQ